MQHVTAWIFDLDDTLYPPQSGLFARISARMSAWLMDSLSLSASQAMALRQDYRHRYGTTLAGLMAEHGIDPQPFLAQVHDIALDDVAPDPALAAAIAALPGRKFVHTNGSRAHAQRVTRARGLSGLFDGLYGIEDAGFVPKPHRAAFERILALAGVDPVRAALFEDDPRNLAAPRTLGMVCVLVQPPEAPAPAQPVDHRTADLAAFLAPLGRVPA